ncbi:hypothetical protein POM88_051306 [Heracleum sosnowskyi]|uniref:Uncharacterized protein n=1 Tax=Heracleum sosnowskyi TaxID=360622 RepID=A0AAD8M158_9APIA|nr:hypothetical protein POM88_051306 [Heracleum sosnowskyi]
MTYPAARCGVTALRPTFGTVGRTGVMSLSESLAAVSVRNLPPSAVDDPENLDMWGFLDVNKGRTKCIQVYVAGIQAPPVRNWIAEPEKTDASGKTSKQSRGPVASAQKVNISLSFVSCKLHRDVRIVFEGFDKSGLIGSVYYLDGIKKDLAVQLVAIGSETPVGSNN